MSSQIHAYETETERESIRHREREEFKCRNVQMKDEREEETKE
jgi:hypothetical protein